MNPADAHPRSRAARLYRTIAWLSCAGGLVILVEGLSGGAARHRALAAAIGAALLIPVALPLVFRRRFDAILPKLLLAGGATLAALGAVELLIRIAKPSSFQRPERVDDEVLGHRLLADRGGLDALGFRNVDVPDQAAVVCIGDSQTYGEGVRLSETYPSVLEERLDRPVYNMSLGGYGPLQYLALTERALALQPDAIVVGFFFGNDILNSHSTASLPHWRRMQDPDVTYPGLEPAPQLNKQEPNLAMAGLGLLIEHSALVQFAHAEIASRLQKSRYLADTYWQEPGAPRYEDPAIGTLFTPKLRLGPLLPGSVAVTDGLRITEQCFREMRDRCAAQDVTLCVVLLHTKEYYYHRLLAPRGDATASALAQLAQAESEATDAIGSIAERLHIPVAELQDEVVAALEQDRPLWPPNADGHFAAGGHALIAEAVTARLLRLCPRLAQSQR